MNTGVEKCLCDKCEEDEQDCGKYQLLEENADLRRQLHEAQQIAQTLQTADADRDAAEAKIHEAQGEVERLTGRLEIDPGGSDKIDELEQAMAFMKHGYETRLAAVEGAWAKYHSENCGCNECPDCHITDCAMRELGMTFANATPTACPECERLRGALEHGKRNCGILIRGNACAIYKYATDDKYRREADKTNAAIEVALVNKEDEKHVR